MRIEKMSAVPVSFKSGLELVEYAGRICWRSESNCDSEAFVRRIMGRGHTSVLEHAAYDLDAGHPLALTMLACVPEGVVPSRVYFNGDRVMFDARTFFEISGSEDHTIALLGMKISSMHPVYEVVCDRAVSHELVRHRSLSFTQESQRYVNYSKDPDFIVASNFHTSALLDASPQARLAVDHAWAAYLSATAVEEGKVMESWSKPQHARALLPNMCKTRVVVSGWMWQWVWFNALRVDKAAHPDMRVIAEHIQSFQSDLKAWADVDCCNKITKWGVLDKILIPGAKNA